MYQAKTFLAVIPARGGSRRLPKKNMLPLAGKPLIEWSIEAALGSDYIDALIVSSDDPEILTLARQKGAEPLERPSYLATDEASTIDALLHALNSESHEYDFVVLMQATSPLRTFEHVDEAIRLLIEKNADSIVSVTKSEHSPLWANKLPDDGCMKGFLRDDTIGKRGQDLDTYYRLNGALYIVRSNKLLTAKSLFFDKTYAYIMTQETSTDIDTQYDFVCTEAIIEHKLARKL